MIFKRFCNRQQPGGGTRTNFSANSAGRICQYDRTLGMWQNELNADCRRPGNTDEWHGSRTGKNTRNRAARTVGGLCISASLASRLAHSRENVRLPAEVFGDAEVLSRVSEMIDIVGLAGFEQAYPRELSGGMQSRVAIARVLTFAHPFCLWTAFWGTGRNDARKNAN